MTDYKKIDLLAKALTFAIIEHHKNGQTREDNVTPYGEHLVRVIEKLRVIGKVEDYNILIGAALHDILEDTPVPREVLEKEFGAEVVFLVDGMTKYPHQTKEEYLEQIQQAGDGVKIIKLADKLDNIQDLMRLKTKTFGNIPPLEYIAPAHQTLATCRSGSAAIAAELEMAIKQAEEIFAGT